MSALRRKLNVKPGPPDDIKTISAVWREAQIAISSAFSTLAHAEWEEGHVDIRTGAAKELQYALPDSGLCFGYGNYDGMCSLLVHFESGFGARVSSTALALLNEANGMDYKPDNLDLILLKPVVSSLETALSELISNADTQLEYGLDPLGQAVSPLDFDLSKDFDIWSELSFFFKPAEIPVKKEAGQKKSTAASKSKSSKKTPAKAREENVGLGVKILLPQSQLERIMNIANTEIDGMIIDPGSPWTAHMRRSMDIATVPVRAVVENCRMTVADCTRFEIGQVIDLPGVSLQSIGLETDLRDGSINIGSVELGIFKSHRAVKLIEDLDPAFRADTKTIEH